MNQNAASSVLPVAVAGAVVTSVVLAGASISAVVAPTLSSIASDVTDSDVSEPATTASGASASVSASVSAPVLFSSLTADERTLLARRVAQLRAKDRQRIGELEAEIQKLSHTIKAQNSNCESRGASPVHSLRCNAPADPRSLQNPPRPLLLLHGLLTYEPREVKCENCALQDRYVHLFLMYRDKGFQVQSFGKDRNGFKKNTWSLVTSRLCACGHETRIVGEGRTRCVSIEDGA